MVNNWCEFMTEILLEGHKLIICHLVCRPKSMGCLLEDTTNDLYSKLASSP